MFRRNVGKTPDYKQPLQYAAVSCKIRNVAYQNDASNTRQCIL